MKEKENWQLLGNESEGIAGLQSVSSKQERREADGEAVQVRRGLARAAQMDMIRSVRWGEPRDGRPARALEGPGLVTAKGHGAVLLC